MQIKFIYIVLRIWEMITYENLAIRWKGVVETLRPQCPPNYGNGVWELSSQFERDWLRTLKIGDYQPRLKRFNLNMNVDAVHSHRKTLILIVDYKFIM